jgi:hypothetical protein
MYPPAPNATAPTTCSVLEEPDLEPLHRRLDALGSSHQEDERNDHQRELNDDKGNNVGALDGGGRFSSDHLVQCHEILAAGRADRRADDYGEPEPGLMQDPLRPGFDS